MPHLPSDFCPILLPLFLLRLSTPLQSYFTCVSTHIFTYLYVPISLPSSLLTFVQSIGFVNNQDFVFACLCVCFCLFLAWLISSLAFYHHRHLHSRTSSWSSFVLFPGFLLWIRNHGRGAGSGQELEGRASSSHLYRPDCCCQAGAGFVGASGSASLSLRWSCSVTSDWEVSTSDFILFQKKKKRKEKQFSILALLSSWISYEFVLVRGLLCV